MSKLFIYIPTFNRPDALVAQLSALVPQVLKYPEQVRLLVNDNSSNNQLSFNLVKKYVDHGNIEIKRNGGNIGGNANIALGFAFARPGEFLWILSDNDIVTERAVEYVLDQLDKEIDFYCFTGLVKEPMCVDHDWLEGWRKPMEWSMGLISNALYNFDSIQTSIEDAFYFHNSSFPHLAVACSAAKKKGIVKFKLLPAEKTSNKSYNSSENEADYSLAQVCMPLLLPLFSAAEAKSFSHGWLKNHGIYFYRNRKKRFHLYLQSSATLAYYGGWSGQFLLLWMRLVYYVASPLIDIRQGLIKLAKDNFSPNTIEKLKKLRSKIFGQKHE